MDLAHFPTVKFLPLTNTAALQLNFESYAQAPPSTGRLQPGFRFFGKSEGFAGLHSRFVYDHVRLKSSGFWSAEPSLNTKRFSGSWHCQARSLNGENLFHLKQRPSLTSVSENKFVAKASATSAFGGAAQAGQSTEQEEDETFACPICYNPLIRVGPRGLTRSAVQRSQFRCQRCQRGFSSKGVYLDLVVTSGVKEYREPPLWAGTELFRNPVISYVYERGWRQNFARSGFPGADEEFQMAQRYLEPAKGGLLLDVSCGSGLFSRRFLASGDYKAVIASDFSETMLGQAEQFINEDRSLSQSNVVLVRADVARLPFPSASVDAVHAGAALHCWPSPTLALAEISRILKPGGVFVATTFLAPRAPIGDEFVKPLRQAFSARVTLGMKYWEPEELEELCNVCGLVEYTRDQRSNFIMLAARKHA